MNTTPGDFVKLLEEDFKLIGEYEHTTSDYAGLKNMLSF